MFEGTKRARVRVERGSESRERSIEFGLRIPLDVNRNGKGEKSMRKYTGKAAFAIDPLALLCRLI